MPIFGDDEMAFYLDREDFPEFVDDVLTTYLKHSKIFFIYLLISIATEFATSYITSLNREQELE